MVQFVQLKYMASAACNRTSADSSFNAAIRSGAAGAACRNMRCIARAAFCRSLGSGERSSSWKRGNRRASSLAAKRHDHWERYNASTR
jgi:hypothetical protein